MTDGKKLTDEVSKSPEGLLNELSKRLKSPTTKEEREKAEADRKQKFIDIWISAPLEKQAEILFDILNGLERLERISDVLRSEHVRYR